MATSNVSIANLGLQKLGLRGNAIVSLTENSTQARAMNHCFEPLRDKELRAYLWKFATKRVTLAPHATPPSDDVPYDNAFPVPSDFLRVIKPARRGLDWHLELHQNVLCILTNDGTSLSIRYIARITDPTLFDSMFVEMLACKLAWQTCEALTASNTKKDAIMNEYKDLRAEARRTNAFEVPYNPEPVDTWLAARQTGQLVYPEYQEE